MGVTLDPVLTFNQHACRLTDVVRACTYHTCALRHIRPLLSVAIPRSRLPHLSLVRDWTIVTVYCTAPRNATWIDFSGHRINLRVLSAGTTDSQCYRFAPSTIHWLPIIQRIAFKLAAVAYKTRQSGIPEYLHCDIRDYQRCRTLRSTSALLLQQQS